MKLKKIFYCLCLISIVNCQATIFAEDIPECRMTGILYSETDPSAFINGEVVSVGDMVCGGKIIAIEKDNVIIEINGEKKNLQLAQATEKK